MNATAQVAVAFAAILSGLLGTALFQLLAIVRSDLAEVKRTLADVKANTDRIPELAGRLDRLEAQT